MVKLINQCNHLIPQAGGFVMQEHQIRFANLPAVLINMLLIFLLSACGGGGSSSNSDSGGDNA